MTDKHNPGNDPKAAQREAEELKPNQDTQNNRDNIAEDEMGVPGEDQLDASEKQSRPLTRPEDNAKVDRVASAETAETSSPRAQDYLISPRGLRNLFIVSNVAGVAIVVFVLTLASSGPQGRLTPADETQYQRTLLEATDTISVATPNEGGQTARIPIDEAISLVAQRGLSPVAEELAAPAESSAPANAAPAGGEAAQTTPAPANPRGNAAQSGAAPAPQARAQAPQVQQPAPQQRALQPQAQPANLDLSAGETVYTTNCASCHQADGQGVTGAFPPLAGHTPALYNADRSYLINLLLYGLQGEVQVEGEPYNGVMPAWQQLSDDDIANVLNYVTHAWDNAGALQNFQPYEASEVESARDAGLSATDVYDLRQQLGFSGDN